MTTTVSEPQTPSPTEYADLIAQRPYAQAVRKGDYDLTWFNAEPDGGIWGQWGIKAEPSERGITLMDIDRASGLYPGPHAPPGVTPRGAGNEPGLGPREWDLNEKHELWGENLVTLYEEATSRQWRATEDIDWHLLEPLPPDLERAACQFNTFLTMGEYLVNDVLAPWIPAFNTYYHEIKLFLATQLMDEARHTEVFRKRTFANGGGLGMTLDLGNALAAIGATKISSGSGAGSDPDKNPLFSTWDHVSYAIHVVFEGAILSMFRFGEYLGKTDLDKQIFRMVMQDEARHVAYGTMHLKYLVDNSPNAEAQLARLHDLATASEMFFLDLFFMHPATVESCSILAGDGVDGIEKGLEIYKMAYRKMREEYLLRTESAGLNRREECMFPPDLPF